MVVDISNNIQYKIQSLSRLYFCKIVKNQMWTAKKSVPTRDFKKEVTTNTPDCTRLNCSDPSLRSDSSGCRTRDSGSSSNNDGFSHKIDTINSLFRSNGRSSSSNTASPPPTTTTTTNVENLE